MTSPHRLVVLPAMLVAVEPLDTCASTVAADDPRVQDLVAACGAPPGGWAMDANVKVEFDKAGRVRRARALNQISHDNALEEVASLGARPTTPDEWEYACGAGARTLFRWGDDTPDEAYPSGQPAGPHQQPNLWGLMIGRDPYRPEWTAEPTIACGGDGGASACGGIGFFLGWLTLATAYRDKYLGAWLNSKDSHITELLIRAVADII